MAQVNWTAEQAQAIEARGGSLLVSAAAGSGKTAVLSERVLRRATDPDHPVDLDRLLIVTFTEAAVAQMRDKISGKLQELLEERPGDPLLRRQQLLLGRAQISTMHAFCLGLCRQNFQKLGLPPDFSIGSEGEFGNMREEALRECVEEYYAGEQSEQFIQLVELVSSGRDDRKLFDMVFRLYDFVRSHPFYGEWLDEKLRMYDPETPVCDTVWGQVILSYAGEALRYCAQLLREAVALSQENEKMARAYLGALTTDLARVEELAGAAEAASEAADWNRIGALLGQMRGLTKFAGAVRGEQDNPAKKRVSAIRDEVKGTVGKLADSLFAASSDDFLNDIRDLRPKIGLLFDLTKAFDARLGEKKRERKLVDFSDLEHFALALLYDTGRRDERGLPLRSELARELSGRFEEIMIDEYQDTNEAQNRIFSAVARLDAAGGEQDLFLVGDVKQSIYRFRQAMPELFMEKKKRYHPYDGVRYPARINLGANFRSRAGVTDAVNFVFRQLMSERMGELDYGGEEELIPRAAYPPGDECGLELAVVDNSDGENEEEKIRLEARQVARRITELLASGYQVLGKDGMRPATQGDFCVLLRSVRGKIEPFVRELRENGVNAWGEAAGGYLTAREIAVMLAFLRVIDNPLLDLSLAGVMLSDLFGFSPDELAAVRLLDRRRALYLNVCRAAEQGDEKCRALALAIRRYGTAAVSEPIDRLLLRIYRETDYPASVAALPMGENRQANLRLLAEYAAGYNQAGHKGLCGFVRFVDRVLERGADLRPANTMGESGGMVHVMTIHHSKGLEFPVVFLCDTAKQHNNSDYTRERSILHPQLGFACRRRDPELLREFTTVPMEALKLESERSALSEELRVLYVAMTRAKEKLIVTMVQNRLGAKLRSLAACAGTEERIPPFVVRRCRSFADWLLLCALRHPDGTALRTLAGVEDGAVLEEQGRVAVHLCRPLPAAGARSEETVSITAKPSAELLEEIRARCAFRYPHAEATRLPAKLGVSELVRQEHGRAFRFTRAPRFLTRQELTGAQKGSALHQFMQFADYAAASRDAEAELDRMRQLGFLTRAQSDSVDVARVRRFFESDLYRRIASSPEVRRELRFLSQIPASTLGLEAGADDAVTVQGVADCVFREGDGCVIVDYKTDRAASAEALAERYAPQLALYRRILEESLQIPVRECILYSFAFGQAVSIPPDADGGFA